MRQLSSCLRLVAVFMGTSAPCFGQLTIVNPELQAADAPPVAANATAPRQPVKSADAVKPPDAPAPAPEATEPVPIPPLPELPNLPERAAAPGESPASAPAPGLLPETTRDPWAPVTADLYPDDNAGWPLANPNEEQRLEPVIATPPDGFANRGPGFTSGNFAKALGGFGWGASLTTTYDSNINMGRQGPLGTGDQDDFIASLSTTFNYRSTGPEWYYAVNGSVGYNHYFDMSDYSGPSYGAGFLLGYNGAKLQGTLNLAYSYSEGFNRYNAGYVEQGNLAATLSAAYRLSAKTSLTFGMGTTLIGSEGSGSGDTNDFNVSTGLMWQYSPLLSFGPGVRYTSQSGDRQGDRTSIGPYLAANYELTSKVSLNSQLGVDFSDYSGLGGGSDESLFASVGLNYRLSELWAFSLALSQSTQPQNSFAGGYRETLSIRAGATRQIRRAALNLGVSWETDDYAASGAIAGTQSGGDYYTFDASLGMPVFRDRATASIFFRYSEDDGGLGGWDGYQIGISLGASF